MAEIEPMLPNEEGGQPSERERQAKISGSSKAARVASLDVFRGLCVFLMMLVDYGGSIFPIIVHAPWNGVHLADFVMPFFLFVAGVSVAIAYKKVPNRIAATWKALLKALKLILLGVLLQGGYFHGATSLSYGVDIEKLRFPGILQRIAIGYIVAAICEIWLPRQRWREDDFRKTYIWQWCVVFFLSVIYLWLLYGIYVPDWKFSVVLSDSSTAANNTFVYKVKCAVRGDLGPACNSAGMIDRFVLGLDHLYAKPVYRNLKECNISSHGQVPLTSPSWCHAPFDPEGILSSFTAAVACIIGLHYGHTLIQLQHHKERLWNWSICSVLLMVLGLLLAFSGTPLNKSLYTISYLMVTSGTAGITFCILYTLIYGAQTQTRNDPVVSNYVHYLGTTIMCTHNAFLHVCNAVVYSSRCDMVDVYGWRHLTFMVEWMGKHSLSLFILITSNMVVIAVQGFYIKAPENNIIHWIITRFVHK